MDDFKEGLKYILSLLFFSVAFLAVISNCQGRAAERVFNVDAADYSSATLCDSKSSHEMTYQGVTANVQKCTNDKSKVRVTFKGEPTAQQIKDFKSNL